RDADDADGAAQMRNIDGAVVDCKRGELDTAPGDFAGTAANGVELHIQKAGGGGKGVRGRKGSGSACRFEVGNSKTDASLVEQEDVGEVAELIEETVEGRHLAHHDTAAGAAHEEDNGRRRFWRAGFQA